MKHRSPPETRGSGHAKEVELQRVKRAQDERNRRIEREAKRETKMNAPVESTEKTREYTKQYFGANEIDKLRKAIGDNCSELALERCAIWFSGTDWAKLAQHRATYSRGVIKRLLDPCAPHKAKLRDMLAYIVENYSFESGGSRNPEPVVSRPVVVEVIEGPPRPYIPEPPPTSIVRHVGDLEFRLPTADLAGAQAARITLTELARKLGYGDKDTLRQLASRHSQELAELGGNFTIKVPCKAGARGWTTVDEPTYSVEQGTYLALASETPQGRASRVGIIKAYNQLLAEFGRMVNHAAGTDPLMAQTLHMLASGQQTTNLLLGELLSRKKISKPKAKVVVPEQTVIPQTQVSDPVAVDTEKTEPNPNDVLLAKLRNHPRLAAFPRPCAVQDAKLHQTTRNLIEAWGQIAGDGYFHTPYEMTYDEANRTFDPELKKRKHGSRIEYIGSCPKEYQRKVYECAYRVLVEPNMRG
jgi:hypothetical protein